MAPGAITRGDDLSRSYRGRRRKGLSTDGDYAKTIEAAAWILGRMEKDSAFFEENPPRELPTFDNSGESPAKDVND
jgi:hypothetical protein